MGQKGGRVYYEHHQLLDGDYDHVSLVSVRYLDAKNIPLEKSLPLGKQSGDELFELFLRYLLMYTKKIS